MPVGLLVALLLAADRPALFILSAMVIVGAHYVPFVFLFGMRLFAVLAALLVGGGEGLAVWMPGPPALGGWLTGAVLVGFAFGLRRSAT